MLSCAALGPIHRSPIWTIHAGQPSSPLIYGGGFLDKDDKSRFRPGLSIPDDAPPVFMLVAHDDKSNPIEASLPYLEYKKRDVSAELHICAKGGHGFGMRKEGKPNNDWPQRYAE